VLWCPGPAGPEFLLLRNALHGTWGFAKGHLDTADADPAAGALRELLEETGVALEPGAHAPCFADASSYRPRERWKRVVLYLAELPDGQEVRSSEEHDDWGWFGERDALDRLDHQELRRSLIRAAARVG